MKNKFATRCKNVLTFAGGHAILSTVTRVTESKGERSHGDSAGRGAVCGCIGRNGILRHEQHEKRHARGAGTGHAGRSRAGLPPQSAGARAVHPGDAPCGDTGRQPEQPALLRGAFGRSGGRIEKRLHRLGHFHRFFQQARRARSGEPLAGRRDTGAAHDQRADRIASAAVAAGRQPRHGDHIRLSPRLRRHGRRAESGGAQQDRLSERRSALNARSLALCGLAGGALRSRPAGQRRAGRGRAGQRSHGRGRGNARGECASGARRALYGGLCAQRPDGAGSDPRASQ